MRQTTSAPPPVALPEKDGPIEVFLPCESTKKHIDLRGILLQLLACWFGILLIAIFIVGWNPDYIWLYAALGIDVVAMLMANQLP